MMQEKETKSKQVWRFHTWVVTKRPPLKESRPEIPRKKGKGWDTSDEVLLRSPMLPLYQNDETIAL